MSPANDLGTSLINTLLRHVPPDQTWVAPTSLGVLIVAGLLIALKGARWSPWIFALAGAGLGVALGGPLRGFLGTPLPPTMALAGVAGLILAWLFYRVFLGLFLATTLAGLALAAYGGYRLQDPLRTYLERGLNLETGAVTLQPALGTPGVQDPQAALQNLAFAEEMQRLWSHMNANVPNLGVTLGVLVAIALAVGFLAGLFVPRAASAFWAASLGTAVLATPLYGLVHLYWPSLLGTLGQWSGILLGVLWGTSFLYNLVDVYTPVAKEGPPPNTAPARAAAAVR